MGRILWFLANRLQSLAIIVWTGLWITVALVVAAVTRGTEAPLALARRAWAPGVLRIGGARLRVQGLENLPAAGPLYVVSNHQSHFDIPALFASVPLPLRFVAKRELAEIPFLGWYIRATGMVTIDRSRLQSGQTVTVQVAERLREDAVILSFPAGTRSRDGSVGRFKPGGFRAPIEAGAPVLPIAIWGAHRVMPAGTLRLRPGTIAIAIGPPIPTLDFTPQDRSALAERAEDAVRTMQEELRSPLPEQPEE
jgi:1-acyl-sn-glycerol-3-phosphate acyltransferase